MAAPQSSAVILGGSMSGLLAARALSTHFTQVTVVERDLLPGGPQVRQGVPQAAHAHGLLASGYRVIDGYFPGLLDDLERGGAPRGDVVGDFLWFQFGRWKLRHQSGLRGITVSRPCLEAAVRDRVRALPNVTVLESTACVAPIYNRAAACVTGVTVKPRDTGIEKTVPADLVVDASGRGSHSPQWLESWGFDPPMTSSVKVDVGYATRIFERRPGDFYGSTGAVISATPPHETRSCAMLAAEGNRWVVTLIGTLGDFPSAEEKGWADFAATLPHPSISELVKTARPLSEIATYRFPANSRRHYERMKRFPAGYLVIGDAMCSFNPVYGQGMSVAAMEAVALDEALAPGIDGVAQRFFTRAAKIIDIPWTIATGEDLRYPQVEGPRPAGSALVNRYLERVHAVAAHDQFVCRKFFDVLNLLAPPTSLLAPSVAWRVLASRVAPGQGDPNGGVPSSAPAAAAT